MRINKEEGAILALLIMSPYVFFYYWWTKDSPHSLLLTIFFFLGIFLHFLRKIEAGTTAELLFFEKSTGHFWSDGFCLVPSILPALHNIGIYLLWNLKKAVIEEIPRSNPNISVQHYQDQRIPVYKVDANASLLALTIHHFFSRLGNWFFSLETKNPELVYQKLGFRIVIIAIVFGWFGNIFTNIPSDNKQVADNEKTVAVYVQLDTKKISPIFPKKKAFTVSEDQKAHYYAEYDGIKYVQYQKMKWFWQIPQVPVKESLCIIIPAGEKIGFATDIPPQFVANMVDSVSFVLNLKKIPLQDQNIFMRLGYNPSIKVNWGTVALNWDKVDTDKYTITATAMKAEDIPAPHSGGLVCF